MFYIYKDQPQVDCESVRYIHYSKENNEIIFVLKKKILEPEENINWSFRFDYEEALKAWEYIIKERKLRYIELTKDELYKHWGILNNMKRDYERHDCHGMCGSREDRTCNWCLSRDDWCYKVSNTEMYFAIVDVLIKYLNGW